MPSRRTAGSKCGRPSSWTLSLLRMCSRKKAHAKARGKSPARLVFPSFGDGLLGQGLAHQAFDKLPRRPGRAAVLPCRPLQCKARQMLAVGLETVLLREGVDDLQVLRLAGRGKDDGDAEAVGEGELFLERILAPDLVGRGAPCAGAAVAKLFFDEVAAVG